MISVTVQRSDADKPGPDISDPLITADEVARERGRNEIDRQSTNRAMVTATGPHRQRIAPGSLVEYIGRRQTWRGLVKRCSIVITRDGDGYTADRNLEMEREL